MGEIDVDDLKHGDLSEELKESFEERGVAFYSASNEDLAAEVVSIYGGVELGGHSLEHQYPSTIEDTKISDELLHEWLVDIGAGDFAGEAPSKEITAIELNVDDYKLKEFDGKEAVQAEVAITIPDETLQTLVDRTDLLKDTGKTVEEIQKDDSIDLGAVANISEFKDVSIDLYLSETDKGKVSYDVPLSEDEQVVIYEAISDSMEKNFDRSFEEIADDHRFETISKAMEEKEEPKPKKSADGREDL
jgi:hypothetical protein